MTRSSRRLTWLAFASLTAACATAPPARPPAVPVEQKLAWIVRLEDRRTLREEAPAPIAPPPAAKATKRAKGAPPPPPPVPDLRHL
ncbi:MAG: hypothetical protein ACRD1S_16100, partial [Vicinamibacterales bacterium]